MFLKFCDRNFDYSCFVCFILLNVSSLSSKILIRSFQSINGHDIFFEEYKIFYFLVNFISSKNKYSQIYSVFDSNIQFLWRGIVDVFTMIYIETMRDLFFYINIWINIVLLETLIFVKNIWAWLDHYYTHIYFISGPKQNMCFYKCCICAKRLQ